MEKSITAWFSHSRLYFRLSKSRRKSETVANPDWRIVGKIGHVWLVGGELEKLFAILAQILLTKYANSPLW